MPKPEINFDYLAEMRAESEGMTGNVKPLPIPMFETRLSRTEQYRATDEGMPEPIREILMQQGVITRLK